MSEGETKEEKWSRFRKKCCSLSIRLPFLFVVSGILIMMLVIPIIYFRFKNRMIDEYSRIAEGVTNLMAHSIDAELVDEYLEKNFEMKEYRDTRIHLQNLKENYPDILYMYVYRVESDGAHVIFDLDTKEEAGDPPGSMYELDPGFMPYLDDLCRGAQLPALAEHTRYGYLLTYLKPVFDSEGKYQCHVGVDFSMDYLYTQDVNFIIGILAIFGLAVALILIFDIYMIRRDITGPLNKMSAYIKDFTYETEEDRFRNVQTMEDLNISTHDEIEDLYHEFMSVMKESLFYMTNLNRAKNDILDKEDVIDQISETAYKDVLTGVGNHASYNKAAEQLNKDIENGKALFAIVMADVNNLKYVNDTYGHDAGDRYIKGCCKIICDIYKHSSVYRVGGDEFVVIIQNEDYASRLLRLTKIKEIFVGTYGQEDAEGWARYSASIGMAEWTPEDQTVKQVLKRADAAMYEDKSNFKKKFGSYR